MFMKLDTTVRCIEKLFLILAILCLSLLFLFQFLHIRDSSLLSSIDKSFLRNEIHNAKPIFSAGKLTLEIKNIQNGDQDFSVLVNGETYGQFTHNQIELIVRNGDIISISSPHEDFRKVELQVSDLTENITSPRLNDVFILNSNNKQICTIKLSSNL